MSANQIAYHLRVNKFIDRCLFLEALGMIGHIRKLDDYGYISMGGNFLEDFRVIHQSLGINRMYSFDEDAAVISRQEVNKPYGFIKCNLRDSRNLVENYDAIRTEEFGEDCNTIVWLDFTSPAGRQDQLIDVETLAAKLFIGDILRVTMNANRTSLGSNDEYNKLKSAGLVDHFTLWDFRHSRLLAHLGQQFPPDRNDSKYLENNSGFNNTLSHSIKYAINNSLEKRNDAKALPLLTTAYSDGQEMITTTCVVLDAARYEEVVSSEHWAKWQFKPGDDWDDFANIEVPNLSLRERHAIHREMITNGPPDVSKICFQLDSSAPSNDRLFKQYHEHYLRYPTFAPLDIV